MGREIIDYTLAEDFTRGSLASDVRDLIKEGWQPHGSLTICYLGSLCGRDVLYCQAMVKYKKEEPSNE